MVFVYFGKEIELQSYVTQQVHTIPRFDISIIELKWVFHCVICALGWSTLDLGVAKVNHEIHHLCIIQARMLKPRHSS